MFLLKMFLFLYYNFFNFRETKFLIMITGTPAMSRPVELFNLLAVLRPNVFKNFLEYANRYCNPKPSPFNHGGIDYGGSSNIPELKYLN